MSQRPRIVTAPPAGYYLLRLVPKGWQVPARIDIRDGTYVVEIDGSPVGEWDEAGVEAVLIDWITAEASHPLARLIMFGELCDETTYRHRLATRAWAQAHAAWHPSLHPHEPMDARVLPAKDF